MFETQLLNEIAGALSILFVGLTAILTLDVFLKWQHRLQEKEEQSTDV